MFLPIVITNTSLLTLIIELELGKSNTGTSSTGGDGEDLFVLELELADV